MKLVISTAEVRTNLANQYGIPVECVEVTPEVTPGSPLTSAKAAEQIEIIMKEARCHCPNKINMIKAHRTLTGFGLYESKCAVEKILDSGSPF